VRRRVALRVLLSLPALSCATRSQKSFSAETYPNRPIKLIVPFPPGQVSDIHARRIADPLGKALGQPIVIENRPGASGTIGAAIGARAVPDGYTLTISGTAALAIAPVLMAKLDYDPLKNFAPITQYVRTGLVLLAHPSFPAKTGQDFIKLSKSSKEPLQVATGGITTPTRFALELLQAEADIHLRYVPYQKSAPALAAMGNEVPLAFDFAATSSAHVQAGKLRALLVTGATRMSSFPGTPTVRELGLPGAEIYAWAGILAPYGTPTSIVTHLHRETVAVIRRSEMQAMFVREGGNVVGNSPQEFRSVIAAEQVRFAKLAKLRGIHLEDEEG
jgi:tripartite-type tricarboxylate transporter receptor subunit TctC